MSDLDHNRSLKCVAWLMHAIRPDWDFNGCLAIVRRIGPERSIAEIAAAGVWFARHRTEQRTPAALAEDGAHWRLDDGQPQVVLPPRASSLQEPPVQPASPEVIRLLVENMRQKLKNGPRSAQHPQP